MKFDHILADPDWWYNRRLNEQHGGNRTKFGNGVWHKYLTPPSDLQAICDMPVHKIAADECFLHLWVTCPHLFDAASVIWNWGTYWDEQVKELAGECFEFVTVEFVWVKISKQFIRECLKDLQGVLQRMLNQHENLYEVLIDGSRKLPGNYTASNVELVLLAKRGKPKRAKDRSIFFPQLIFTPLPDVPHAKPDRVLEYIDRSWPDAKKVELYARRQWMTSGQKEWVCLGNEVPGQKGLKMEISIPIIAGLEDGDDWAKALAEKVTKGE